MFTVADLEKESQENHAPWYIPKLARAGDLTLLGGESKRSGKTTLLMHGIKAAAAGELFLGEPTMQTGALVLTEQGNNILQATRKAGITDEHKIRITPYREVSAEDWSRLVPMAIEACEEEELGILSIDTFTAFAKLHGTDENAVGEVRERMAPLLDAVRVHNLAVILTHHTNREGQIRGSSHFFADPDVIWTLKRPVGDHAANVRTLEGIGRYDSVNTTFNIALEDSGYVFSGSTTQIERNNARNEIRKRLPNREEACKLQSELISEIGLSGTTVRRALDELIDDGEVRRKKLPGRGSPVGLWRPADLFAPNSRGMGRESGANKKPDRNGKYSGSTQEGGAKCGAKEFAYITTSERISAVLGWIAATHTIGVDIETTGLDPETDSISLQRLP